MAGPVSAPGVTPGIRCVVTTHRSLLQSASLAWRRATTGASMERKMKLRSLKGCSVVCCWQKMTVLYRVPRVENIDAQWRNIDGHLVYGDTWTANKAWPGAAMMTLGRNKKFIICYETLNSDSEQRSLFTSDRVHHPPVYVFYKYVKMVGSDSIIFIPIEVNESTEVRKFNTG